MACFLVLRRPTQTPAHRSRCKVKGGGDTIHDYCRYNIGHCIRTREKVEDDKIKERKKRKNKEMTFLNTLYPKEKSFIDQDLKIKMRERE